MNSSEFWRNSSNVVSGKYTLTTGTGAFGSAVLSSGKRPPEHVLLKLERARARGRGIGPAEAAREHHHRLVQRHLHVFADVAERA